MTLIDGNVGGPETDTIDGSANGAERESEQRAAPAAPTLTDTSKTRPAGSTAPVSGGMRVRKRSGALEPVDVNKIVNAIARASEGLLGVDPMRVATRTISALADGASTRELDDLSIRTAAGLIVEEPTYSKLASRLLATVIDKEVRNQNIPWFSQSIVVGHGAGLVADNVLAFVEANAPYAQRGDRLRPRPVLRVLRPAHRVRPLPAAPPPAARGHRDPAVLLPARGLRAVANTDGTGDIDAAVKFYRPDVVARLPPVEPRRCSTPARRTRRCRAATCSTRREDSLEGIYKRYTDIAKLSKFAGGIGVACHRVRGRAR